MKLLPLGSIIKVNNYKVCIIGYGSADKEEASQYGYFVVLYPIGFTSIEKALFIPHNLEFEIIAEGYNTELSQKVLDNLAKSLEMIKKVSYEDLLKFSDALRKVALKREVDE